METLTHADWQRLLEFLRLLYTPCNLDEFPAQILSTLPKLVGSELFGYVSLSLRNIVAPRFYTVPVMELGMVAESITAQRQYFLGHPLVHYYYETMDGQALAISDFLSEHEFYRLETPFATFLQHFGFQDQMCIVFEVPTTPDANPFHQGREHLSLGLSRDRRNFTERDRLLLNLIRPHVKQAYENVAAFTQLHHQITQLQQASEQAGLIALAMDGTLQWMTQRAGHLLHHYFPTSNVPISLPDLLQRWLKQELSKLTQTTDIPSPPRPLRLEQNGQQLTVRLSYNSTIEQITLLLEETQPECFSPKSLEILGLTKREAEVLFWVAKDQSTQEIAKRLGISDRTVKKHLEHIYEKFGVQTRVAAVMLALEKLGIVTP